MMMDERARDVMMAIEIGTERGIGETIGPEIEYMRPKKSEPDGKQRRGREGIGMMIGIATVTEIGRTETGGMSGKGGPIRIEEMIEIRGIGKETGTGDGIDRANPWNLPLYHCFKTIAVYVLMIEFLPLYESAGV